MEADLTLALRTDDTGESLSGTLAAAGGPTRSFAGWIGLLQAVEQSLREDPVADDLAGEQ